MVDDDFAGAGLGAEAGGEVYAVAQHGVIPPSLGAHVAGHDFARADADADVDRARDVVVELLAHRAHGEAAAHGVHPVITVGVGRAEEHHDLVAHVFIDNAVVLLSQVGHDAHVRVDEVNDIARVHAIGQRREPADVAKERRHFAHFTAELDLAFEHFFGDGGVGDHVERLVNFLLLRELAGGAFDGRGKLAQLVVAGWWADVEIAMPDLPHNANEFLDAMGEALRYKVTQREAEEQRRAEEPDRKLTNALHQRFQTRERIELHAPGAGHAFGGLQLVGEDQVVHAAEAVFGQVALAAVLNDARDVRVGIVGNGLREEMPVGEYAALNRGAVGVEHVAAEVLAEHNPADKIVLRDLAAQVNRRDEQLVKARLTGGGKTDVAEAEIVVQVGILWRHDETGRKQLRHRCFADSVYGAGVHLRWNLHDALGVKQSEKRARHAAGIRAQGRLQLHAEVQVSAVSGAGHEGGLRAHGVLRGADDVLLQLAAAEVKLLFERLDLVVEPLCDKLAVSGVEARLHKRNQPKRHHGHNAENGHRQPKAEAMPERRAGEGGVGGHASLRRDGLNGQGFIASGHGDWLAAAFARSVPDHELVIACGRVGQREFPLAVGNGEYRRVEHENR